MNSNIGLINKLIDNAIALLIQLFSIALATAISLLISVFCANMKSLRWVGTVVEWILEINFFLMHLTQYT